MPPPSNRPGRKDTVPLVISPSAPCRAQPVVVPRSSASNVRSARKAGGRSGIASCILVARVRSAMGGLLFRLAARVEDDGGFRAWRCGPPSSDRTSRGVSDLARGYPSTYGRRGQTCRLASPYVVWGLAHSSHVLAVRRCSR